MKIAEGKDVRLGICDIETFLELFDVGIYNPDTQEWREFEVSAYKNELFEFVREYTSGDYDYLVTYNGISFDQPVMEWVVDNHQKWVDLNGLEICAKISDFAAERIDDSKHGLFPPYRESNFKIPALDVMTINHFDNEQKRTSLKWCEFMLNMDVEEMPYHHLTTGLTKEQIEEIKTYRRHDVMATYKLLLLTLGETDMEELADYKGRNAIQSRFYIMEDTGLPCLNWSDVKIGEESNKLRYMKAEGITDEKQLFTDRVRHPYGQKFKNFFPKTMDFKSAHIQGFMNKLGQNYVLAQKQKFPVTIGETTYTIAKGGIHSTEKDRKLVIPQGWKAKDADVGGQYPNSCIKHNIYPPHLKRTILINLIGSTERKDKYKQMGKEATDNLEKAKLKGLEGGTKLEMNGGYYGKMGQPGSFLEYPEGVLKVCMGNQVEILMLVEMMEGSGFKVISGNTDGIVTLYPADRETEYFRICREWEEAVGNTKMGKLEFAEIDGLWQDSVNSYIAKIRDEKGGIKIKKKGRFVTTYGSPGCEINKDKSGRIIPLALEAYFINGQDPIEFIKNHKNIYDFCFAEKAVGRMHYEEQWKEEDKIMVKVHKKLVVFYLSTEGTILFKRGFNHKGKPMNNHVNAKNEVGQPLIQYFNRFFQSDDYKIDYNQYIYETLVRIDSIEKTNRLKPFLDSLKPIQQLSLF